jgi:hypothetical protein
VERAKREAAEVLQRYEHQLALSGRIVECLQLGIPRYLLTAPIDFLARVDDLRAACPEMDRVRAREALRVKLDEWRRQMDAVEGRIEAGGEGGESLEDELDG